MKRLRVKLSYANVVSTLALFLVLAGGSAFAAAQLAKNSVGSKQLKANAVTTNKIKAGAVNSGRLADGAVSAGKIADGAVGGSKLAGGAVTATKLGTIITRSVSFGIVEHELGTGTAACQSGEVLIGGGADWLRKGPDLILEIAESSKSSTTPNAWTATGNNLNSATVEFRVYAYCLAA
jgi:hypothetical protein